MEQEQRVVTVAGATKKSAFGAGKRRAGPWKTRGWSFRSKEASRTRANSLCKKFVMDEKHFKKKKGR